MVFKITQEKEKQYLLTPNSKHKEEGRWFKEWCTKSELTHRKEQGCWNIKPTGKERILKYCNINACYNMFNMCSRKKGSLICTRDKNHEGFHHYHHSSGGVTRCYNPGKHRITTWKEYLKDNSMYGCYCMGRWK